MQLHLNSYGLVAGSPWLKNLTHQVFVTFNAAQVYYIIIPSITGVNYNNRFTNNFESSLSYCEFEY